MKTIFIFAIVATLASSASQAQFSSFGVSAAGGLSFISLKSSEDISNMSLHDKPMPAFQGGIFAAFQLTKKSGLESELNYLLQQGRTETVFSPLWIVLAPYEQYPGSGTDVSTNTINYLTLPVRYSYRFGSLTLMAGIQTGIMLNGRGRSEAVIYAPDTTFYYANDYSLDHLHPFDFGISLAGSQEIFDRFFVNISIYRSLVGMRKPDLATHSQKNFNALIGVSYSFIPSNKKR